MNPERTLVDHGIGPRARDEFVFVDRLAGAFDKRDEYVQSPAAETQRFPILEQHALSRDQAERSEGEGLFIHREIVLNELPIHTDRGKSSQRDGTLAQAFGPRSRCRKSLQRRFLHNFTIINATSGWGCARLRP